MKRLLLPIILLYAAAEINAQTCTSEQLVSLGDENKLSHTYYDPSTFSVFGVGYFTDTVTVGQATYIAPPGTTGKYVVQMDTTGLIMSSYPVDQGSNMLEFPGGNGFFEPGIGLTNDNLLIVPSTYQDQGGNYIFQVQAWDKGQQGLTMWTQQFLGTATVGGNFGFDMISVASTGDVVLTGVFGDQLLDQQQQTIYTAGTNSTGFVMVLDSKNQYLVKSMTYITGSDQMELFGLTTDEAGNIYVSGNAHKATSITIDGQATSYSGENSGFLFKLDPSGRHQWTHIFESTGAPEVKAIRYDKANDYIHFANVDYESFEKGSTVGALTAKDGRIAWEKNMVVPKYYFISYSSWIDEKDNAIYYSVWGKDAKQEETSLIIDGKVFKDRINKNTYFIKLSLDGTPKYISPSPFTSIGEIAVVNPNRILMQANYQASKNLQGNTLGIFNPENYPVPYLYVHKEGVYAPVTLYASSDLPDVTYQWMINGDPLSGETKSLFTPTAAGEYNVEIYDGKNCPVRSRLYRVEGEPTLEIDSLALVDLYNNTTKNSSWYTNTNWLVGNVATWYGVTVTGGRVTTLNLANNNLNGQIPQTIDRLTELQYLSLEGNNLSGTLPSSFWSLKKLITLSLDYNSNLNWKFHPDIQYLSSLESIRGYNTNLNGSIPAEIGKVSTLRELVVPRCNLTGGLPAEIGNLTALVTLDLTENPIGGTLPSTLAKLTSLQHFLMNSCGLSGEIPAGLWQLPNIKELSVSLNTSLSVKLPDNLESRVQFESINLARLIPMNTPFPEDLYSLVNLTSLDLGGHHLTGSLDSRVSNWKNMEYLWLWDNELEGAIPDEMAFLPLRGVSFSNNKFTSMPELDPGDTILYQLEMERNFFGFDDVIRNNDNFEIFRYAPQKQRPSVYLTVDENGTVDLINKYTTPGNQYQWMLNLSDQAVGTNVNYTITGATLEDLGSYFCRVTNAAVPELVIETEFYNVAFSGSPRSFSVDNSPGSLADFKSFYAAGYGTNAGDTLYVAGSSTPYNMGFVTIETPRIIYGPGYFLKENPDTQATVETAHLAGIGFKKGAEGSEVYGLDIDQVLLNNNSSYLNDVLSDIQFTGNKIKGFSLNDDCRNIRVNKNFIQIFELASTPLVGVSRSYTDINVQNNIIDTVTTVFAKAHAAKNGMENVVFDRNTIKIFTDSIQDATVSNNIIEDNQGALSNNVTNELTFAAAAFKNTSGMLNVDNDFIPTNAVDAGAFSGTEPYLLSGLPEAPHIYQLTNTGRIRINAKGKTIPDANITSLSYRLGQFGVVVDEGTVKSFETGNPVDVLFRPRLGKVDAGKAYDLMLWAQDDMGRRSVHHNISFIAETTTATGNIYTSDDLPVSNGEVLLFEINQEGTAFDTLSASLNSEGGFVFNNIVVGDYLAMGKADTVQFKGQLPTYYERIDLWEKADTLLLDANDAAFDIKLIPVPKETTGEGEITGFLEEMVEVVDETTGRIMKLERKRVSGAGVSVRRAVRNARTSEVVYELVAYVYSDEFGRFDFSGLPPDNYRINIQYPGYPMDQNSHLDITIGGPGSDNYSVEALVAEGKIAVAVTTVTGLMDDIIQSIKVYPNPTAAEAITIVFLEDTALEGQIGLQLYDVTGNLAIQRSFNASDLKNDNKIHLPIRGLEKGTYLLKLYQTNKALGTVRLAVY